MFCGRAICRSVNNWLKIVESFVSSADTLLNGLMKALKIFVNTEISGPLGPSKPFRGVCPSPPTGSTYPPPTPPHPTLRINRNKALTTSRYS